MNQPAPAAGAVSRLADAIDALEQGLALFDAEDRLVLCNAFYARHALAAGDSGRTGLGFVEALDRFLAGLPDQYLFPSNEVWRERRLAYHAARQGDFNYTAAGRRFRLVERRAAEGGAVVLIRDITGDYEREQALREANAEVERASRSKTEFLAHISHELRTPLNVVLGYADLLHQQPGALPGAQGEYLRALVRGAEHLTRIVNDALDLAKVESGNLAINAVPLSVRAVMRDFRFELSALARRAGLKQRVIIEPAVGNVLADRDRLLQILRNFGSNAAKFSSPDGPITVRARKRTEDGRIRFEVSDSGAGIAPPLQTQLFQPFNRLGRERGPSEGSGLGLAIARRLAEAMQGQVGYQDAPGGGALFWLELPAAQAAAGRRRPPPPPREAPPGGFHVTYIEDIEANRDLVGRLLATLPGVKTSFAATAEEGLRLIRAAAPDVVLMDINLPGMDGYEALRRLKADEATAGIPVIAVTAAAMDEEIRRGCEAGFYAYLTKPFRIRALFETLAAAVRDGPDRRA
jgi:signal transduction histidine kinase